MFVEVQALEAVSCAFFFALDVARGVDLSLPFAVGGFRFFEDVEDVLAL